MARHYSHSLVDYFALAALVRCPMHAYALRQEVIELSQRQVWPSHSTIHGSLKRLRSRGYVEIGADDPYYWLKSRHGVVYRLTPHGQRYSLKLLVMNARVLESVRFWMQQHEASESHERQRQRFLASPPVAPGSFAEDYTELGQ